MVEHFVVFVLVNQPTTNEMQHDKIEYNEWSLYFLNMIAYVTTPAFI